MKNNNLTFLDWMNIFEIILCAILIIYYLIKFNLKNIIFYFFWLILGIICFKLKNGNK